MSGEMGKVKDNKIIGMEYAALFTKFIVCLIGGIKFVRLVSVLRYSSANRGLLNGMMLSMAHRK